MDSQRFKKFSRACSVIQFLTLGILLIFIAVTTSIGKVWSFRRLNGTLIDNVDTVFNSLDLYQNASAQKL